jgi:hypothetical protein
MKIFVQIASYRDPDLKNTIQDLIHNAVYKRDLTFGICWQHSKEDFWDDITEYGKQQNIKIIDVDYTLSQGACWARNLTQSLYDGEEFTLQIDSHTRSEPEWDKKVIELYSNLCNNKAIISTYPTIFIPGQKYEEYRKDLYSCHVYHMKNGLISARPRIIQNQTKPIRAVAIAAGFIFGPGKIISDVPYDPDFYFTGEESAIALRLFTHGYDLYHPNIKLFYHYYTRKEQKKHWSDHKNWHRYSTKCHKKLHCLLGRNNDFDLGDYGLGNIRTIEHWRKYSGIDYINKKLHKNVIANLEPPFEDSPLLWLTETQMNDRK